LSLRAIYNIHEVRLLQLEKLRKTHQRKDSLYYENLISLNLLNERKVIQDRIKELNKIEIDINDAEFEALIKTQIENMNKIDLIDEREGVKGDFSYNLAHIDEFRNIAIADLKML